MLASVAPYGILATDHYDALLGYDSFSLCYFGPAIDQGSVCSTTSRFVGGPIVGNGDVVALATSGVAIANPRTATNPYCGNGRVVNVVTGGGSITGKFDIVTGVIDTSGSNPELAACSQAMADAATVSAALAALSAPPAQTLDRVVVKSNDSVTLDAGAGGVINVKTLKLEGGHLSRVPMEPHGCDFGPLLSVTSDPSYTGDIVINVQNLLIGQCAFYDGSHGNARNVIFNVPGSGRTVHIGISAQFGFIPILAPQRTVAIDGDGNADLFTGHSSVWARRVTAKAFTFLEYGDALYCP